MGKRNTSFHSKEKKTGRERRKKDITTFIEAPSRRRREKTASLSTICDDFPFAASSFWKVSVW